MRLGIILKYFIYRIGQLFISFDKNKATGHYIEVFYIQSWTAIHEFYKFNATGHYIELFCIQNWITFH